MDLLSVGGKVQIQLGALEDVVMAEKLHPNMIVTVEVITASLVMGNRLSKE